MGKGGPIWWERGAYLVGGEGLFGRERRANLMGAEGLFGG